MVKLRRCAWCIAVILTVTACGPAIPGEAMPAARSGGDIGDASQVQAVRDTYRSYARAVRQRNGARAASLLTVVSYSFYDNARELALTAVESTVEEQPPMVQTTVYLMRAKLNVDLLRDATAKEVAMAAIGKPAVGAMGIYRFELGSVVIADDVASAQVLIEGQTTSFRIAFAYERGAWKVGVWSLAAISNTILRDTAAKNAMGVDEYVEYLLIRGLGAAKVAKLHKPLIS